MLYCRLMLFCRLLYLLPTDAMLPVLVLVIVRQESAGRERTAVITAAAQCGKTVCVSACGAFCTAQCAPAAVTAAAAVCFGRSLG